MAFESFFNHCSRITLNNISKKGIYWRKVLKKGFLHIEVHKLKFETFASMKVTET